MDILANYISCGKELGYAGKELDEWAERKYREQLERLERAKEKARADEIELERLKQIDKDKEREEKAKEREEKEKDRIFQLKKLELEAKNNTSNVNIGVTRPVVDQEMAIRNNMCRFTFQLFNEKDGSIDTFLKKFEMEMERQNFSSCYWSGLLGKSFTGDIPSKICMEQSDYASVKEQLLRHFGSTEEAYRKKFFEMTLSKEEDPKSYFDSLTSAMDKWLKCAKIEKSFEELKNFIIRDKAIYSLDKTLKAFIQERSPKTIEEIVDLIRNYKLAHPMAPTSKGEDYQDIICFAKGNDNFQRGRQLSRSKMKCGNCGRNNHVTKDCKDKRDNTLTCFICKKKGHIARNCFRRSNSAGNNNNNNRSQGYTQQRDHNSRFNQNRNHCGAVLSRSKGIKFFPGYVGLIPVFAVRDTGASVIAINSKYVQSNQYTGEVADCTSFDGRVIKLRLAYIDIRTPYITGRVLAHVINDAPIDLIIGNVESVKECTREEIEAWEFNNNQAQCNVINECKASNTEESQTMVNNEKDTSVDSESLLNENFNLEKFKKEQREDTTLNRLFKSTEKGNTNKNSVCKVKNDTQLLVREILINGRQVEQIVVPYKYRTEIMTNAHSIPLAGHMGVGKTKNRIIQHYFWPKMSKDVKRFVKQCKVCQMKGSGSNFTKAPIQTGVTATRPFQKVAIDIIGLMPIMSNRGHRYILTLIDICSRYAEAVPLKKIESTDIVQALYLIFTRIGFPEEIISDRGTQFTSKLTKEFMETFGIKQKFTTPYHPQCNGMCERFNKTLKEMLSKVSNEDPKNWDLAIPSILFAYRETTHDSTGFSPFQLIYGNNPRNPLSILKEPLVGTSENREMTNYELVTNKKQQLEIALEEARKNSDNNKEKKINRVNQDRKLRTLEPGDKALLKLKNQNNKLFTEWLGPYDVVRKVTNVDYEIRIKDQLKVFHINNLKKYNDQSVESNICCSIISEEIKEDIEEIATVNTQGQQTYKDVNLEKLTHEQAYEMAKIIHRHKGIFSDLPGKTNVIQHDIIVTDDKPVRLKPYTIPIHLRDNLQKEIDELVSMGLIEPSNSAYASPIVLVKKKDKTIRLCVDYRKLNNVTLFDPYPMNNAEDIMAQLSNATIFSKLDMAKGYYQVGLTDRAKPFTSFVTPLGLYQWKVMSFGLVNAPATFNRMMGMILGHRKDTIFYLDDICVFNDTWENHLKSLNDIFEIIEKHNLTIKPNKLEIGMKEITFLGHKISNNTIKPLEENITKILKIDIPRNKKEVRSLLGVCNFYRKFIPNFSEMVAPLTELIKKKSPIKIIWSQECEMALNRIKVAFSGQPILRLPDIKKRFVVLTDASLVGLGGILGQYHDNVLHPIQYISRKLSEAEVRYATVEREALGVVWCITKLARYLMGTRFILMTDHKPLSFINQNKLNNSRIARWSLILQAYSFTVENIPGVDNILADLLSRCGV